MEKENLILSSDNLTEQEGFIPSFPIILNKFDLDLYY